MHLGRTNLSAFAGVSFAALAIAGPSQAQMTNAAKAFLSEGGISAALIEQAGAAAATELDIPQDWMDKAKEEEPINMGTNDTAEHVAEWLPIFNARYPEIQLDATETSGAARAVQPLLAFKAGKLVRHIGNSVEGSLKDYIAADALEEIDDLPALNGVPEDRRDPEGRYTGMQNTTWCLGYNTDQVKADELPATWADLMARGTPLADGRVGAANRAQLWAINLWTHPDYGSERVTNEILPGFFDNLKPQLRKEGIGGISNLLLAGEFDVALPVPNDETFDMMQTGAPVGFHCPEPVAQYFSLIGMFRNSPSHYSSKILINWMLSQEGQLTRYVTGLDGPIHKDLQTEYSTALGGQFAGKDIALRTLQGLTEELPKLYDVYNPMWTNAGGPER
ncbi:MAG: extracellular solute-binding protein [Hyphomicrobiaceae bacterium]